MSEMKTLKFPGDAEPREIVDAKAREDISKLSEEMLTEESDPTVPDWAKQPQKPVYTAQEVGALPDTTHIPSTADDVNAEPSGAVSQHNVSDAAHSDIRLLIQGLTTRLNTLADSDDAMLDQLSEVVAYIKSNKSLIDAITTSKVSVTDIIDNLTTNVANKPLSAAQGVALKALIDAIGLPTPTAEDAGKAPVVNADGTGYELETVSSAYPVVAMTDATAELAPNTYYKWGEVTTLAITLADPTDATITNEYFFEFISSEAATTLTVPGDIKWAQEPSIEAGKTYQVSIMNGIGVICGA